MHAPTQKQVSGADGHPHLPFARSGSGSAATWVLQRELQALKPLTALDAEQVRARRPVLETARQHRSSGIHTASSSPTHNSRASARASSLSVLARARLIPVSSGLTTTTPLHVRLKDPRDLPTAARHLQRHAVRRQQALRQRPETLGRARHPARRQLLGHPRDSQAQLRGLWHSPDLEGALQGREVAAALPAPAFGKLRRQKARSQGAVPSGGDACRSACEGHLTAPLRLSLGTPMSTPSRRRTITLRDGARVTLRPLTPDDKPFLAVVFERLSEESRYRRFFTTKNSLSDGKYV
jgi:hypothetical protein